MSEGNNVKTAARKSGINLSNPALIYLMIWGLCFGLYNMDITTNIIGLNSETFYLVLCSMATFFISYFIVYFVRISFNGFRIRLKRKDFYDVNSDNGVRVFKRIIKAIALTWIFFTIVEIIQFKGIPLISVVVLKQYDRDYAAFGLPTLHGLLNALYLTVVCSTFILYMAGKNKKYLYMVLMLICWPLAVMSRALLLWALLEIFSIYFLFNLLNLKKAFMLLSIVGVVILFFGYIGDNRGESQTEGRFTDTFVKDENRKITDKLPSGFIWVYLYMTTPLNNVVWNIDKVDPQYNFKYTFAGLLPSVFQKSAGERASKDTPLELYQEAFNVSSYFANYLRDLGLAGTIIFVFLVQMAVCLFYNQAYQYKLGGLVAYATLFNSVVMSIFFDYFFSLVTVFQVVLGLAINYILYSKKSPKHVQ